MGYVAPEVYNAENNPDSKVFKRYSTKADVFSLGLIIASMIFGKRPVYNVKDSKEIEIPYREGVSNELIDLCRWMVKKDPK